jgi:hypothetical protein
MRKELEGGTTHLDCATLPGENGRLAFVAEEIVFTISKLCAENFRVPFQNLKVFLISIIIRVIGRERGRTLMAREFPGSSSNLYSVSASSTHSLVLELPELLADIEISRRLKTWIFRDEFLVVMRYALCPGRDAANGPDGLQSRDDDSGTRERT